MVEIETIKRVAADVGFDLCGVAECRPFDAERAFFGQWLANGFGSSLDYLARNTDKRFDTARLVEGAKSVAVCALSYKNDFGNGYPAECRTKIASYACAKDYHDVIKAMLRQMATALKAIYPSLSGRAFTDSAPILEKRYAVEAGLGWFRHIRTDRRIGVVRGVRPLRRTAAHRRMRHMPTMRRCLSQWSDKGAAHRHLSLHLVCDNRARRSGHTAARLDFRLRRVSERLSLQQACRTKQKQGIGAVI